MYDDEGQPAWPQKRGVASDHDRGPLSIRSAVPLDGSLKNIFPYQPSSFDTLQPMRAFLHSSLTCCFALCPRLRKYRREFTDRPKGEKGKTLWIFFAIRAGASFLPTLKFICFFIYITNTSYVFFNVFFHIIIFQHIFYYNNTECTCVCKLCGKEIN